MLFPGLQDPSAIDEHVIEGLPGHQKIVALTLAAVILVVVIELVRKRKLREEYSIIWTVTAVGLVLLAWQHQALNLFKRVIGAVEPTSALFFGALLFLMFVALQFSVRLSKLTFRNKTLSQRVALLEKEIQDLRDAERASRPARAERQAEQKTHDGAA